MSTRSKIRPTSFFALLLPWGLIQNVALADGPKIPPSAGEAQYCDSQREIAVSQWNGALKTVAESARRYQIQILSANGEVDFQKFLLYMQARAKTSQYIPPSNALNSKFSSSDYFQNREALFKTSGKTFITALLSRDPEMVLQYSSVADKAPLQLSYQVPGSTPVGMGNISNGSQYGFNLTHVMQALFVEEQLCLQSAQKFMRENSALTEGQMNQALSKRAPCPSDSVRKNSESATLVQAMQVYRDFLETTIGRKNYARTPLDEVILGRDWNEDCKQILTDSAPFNGNAGSCYWDAWIIGQMFDLATGEALGKLVFPVLKRAGRSLAAKILKKSFNTQLDELPEVLSQTAKPALELFVKRLPTVLAKDLPEDALTAAQKAFANIIRKGTWEYEDRFIRFTVKKKLPDGSFVDEVYDAELLSKVINKDGTIDFKLRYMSRSDYSGNPKVALFKGSELTKGIASKVVREAFTSKIARKYLLQAQVKYYEAELAATKMNRLYANYINGKIKRRDVKKFMSDYQNLLEQVRDLSNETTLFLRDAFNARGISTATKINKDGAKSLKIILVNVGDVDPALKELVEVAENSAKLTEVTVSIYDNFITGNYGYFVGSKIEIGIEAAAALARSELSSVVKHEVEHATFNIIRLEGFAGPLDVRFHGFTDIADGKFHTGLMSAEEIYNIIRDLGAAARVLKAAESTAEDIAMAKAYISFKMPIAKALSKGINAASIATKQDLEGAMTYLLKHTTLPDEIIPGLNFHVAISKSSSVLKAGFSDLQIVYSNSRYVEFPLVTAEAKKLANEYLTLRAQFEAKLEAKLITRLGNNYQRPSGTADAAVTNLYDAEVKAAQQELANENLTQPMEAIKAKLIRTLLPHQSPLAQFTKDIGSKLMFTKSTQWNQIADQLVKAETVVSKFYRNQYKRKGPWEVIQR